MHSHTLCTCVLVACLLLLTGTGEAASRRLVAGQQQLGSATNRQGTQGNVGVSPTTSRPGTTWPKTLRNSVEMEFVLIPPGEFLMGSSASEVDRIVRHYDYDLKREWIEDETPLHRVRIGRPFYLGKYEVTQGQWEAVMGNNPSRFTGKHRPVETVSWEDVQEFIRRLNAREPGTTYRLPTEAEWEYAARGHDGRSYPWGNRFDSKRLNFCDRNCEYTWKDRSADDGYGQTAPVGSYANGMSPFGVHDLIGNVWEWVQDRYGEYAAGTFTDPQGPASGSSRVIRGGSWDNNAGLCRSAARLHVESEYRFDFLGFRLLRTAP